MDISLSTIYEIFLESKSRSKKGLSLLEALLTITLVTIAVSVVLPVSKIYIVSLREETIKKNLGDVRAAIDKYYEVELQYPESIDDLLENRYLRRMDPEPFGNKWQYKPESGVHEWKDFSVALLNDKPYLASVNYLSMRTQTYTQLVDGDLGPYEVTLNEKFFDLRTSTNYTGINGVIYNQW
jgi:general secretion pathway protein G